MPAHDAEAVTQLMQSTAGLLVQRKGATPAVAPREIGGNALRQTNPDKGINP
jgi:hypothetical protein